MSWLETLLADLMMELGGRMLSVSVAREKVLVPDGSFPGSGNLKVSRSFQSS